MRCENPVMNQILDAYKPMWSLKHAISLMGWDFETYMPREGTEERGVADSQLHMLHKDLLLNNDFIGLVESAKKLGSLSDIEKGIVQGTQQGNNQADQDTQRVDRSRISGKDKGKHGMEGSERKICFQYV